MVKPQTLSLEIVTLALRWSVSSARKRTPAWRRTPLQQQAIFLGPPSFPMPEVGETPWGERTFHTATESDTEFDANHAWTPRERVIIRGMEDYLTRRSEVILVEVGELDAFLLAPTDVIGICRRPSQDVKTTPQKTRFRDVKYARIWDTD